MGIDNKDRYLIFSDESGSWNSAKCDYYIRTFFIIDENKYSILERKYSESAITKSKHPKDADLLIKILN